MTPRPVVFIPESGRETGMGHVYRLLSMAQMLETAYNILFIVQSGETAALIQKSGYECVVSAFTETGLTAHLAPGTIAVIDGYNFSTELFSALREAEIQTVFLDDHATDLPPADLILNTADLQEIPAKQHFSSQYAYGHQYILLRRPFLEAARHVRNLQAPVKNIFICLGATDPSGLTIPLIHQLAELLPDNRFTVLSSPLNRQIEALSALPHVKVVNSAEATEIVRILRTSDLAIVSASNIAQECIATGIPLACIQTADNQRNLYLSLTANKLCYPLGNSKEFPALLRSLAAQLHDQTYREEQLRLQSQWIDGNSASRIRKLFRSLDLTVRMARESDAELLLRWKNDPLTLKNSFNSIPVSFEEHRTWFAKELSDWEAALYLICLDQEPVSLVRFRQQNQDAVIGITVSPEHRGSKFAPRSLVLACKKYISEHSVETIRAYIKEENTISVRSFEAAGFRLHSRLWVDSVPALLLTKTSKND